MTSTPTSAGWEVLDLDEVPTVHFDGGDEGDWKPLRHRLGITAFGINAWVAERAGEHVIERHDELHDDASSHQEVYVVLRGSADFTVGGEKTHAPAGTIVAVRDPSLTREAIAREPGTIVLAVGAADGEAFTPSPWEQRALAEHGLT